MLGGVIGSCCIVVIFWVRVLVVVCFWWLDLGEFGGLVLVIVKVLVLLVFWLCFLVIFLFEDLFIDFIGLLEFRLLIGLERLYLIFDLLIVCLIGVVL